MDHIMHIKTELHDGRTAEGYIQEPTRTGLVLTQDIKRAHHFKSLEAAADYAEFIRTNKPPKAAQTQWSVIMND